MAVAKKDLLRQSVERALRTYDPIRTGDTAIRIDVTNGDVALRGYVRTENMKFVAQELAGKVRGVQSVDNQLVSDVALEVAIALAIEDADGGWLAPLPVQIRVVRGNVLLRGAVPSEGAKEQIERIVLQMPHVLNVHNMLNVDPVRIERAVAPKEGKRIQRDDDSGGKQATVGGEPVTEEDLPDWALMPKEEWEMAEYKARAKVKMAFKQGRASDPNELEEAGKILRAQKQGGDDEEEQQETVEDDLGLGIDLSAAPPAGAPTTAASAAPVEADMTVDEVKDEYPSWAWKPKDDWDKDDFKAHAKAKSAAKKGEGPDPDELKAEAEEKMEAAKAAEEAGGGAPAPAAGGGMAREEAIEELSDDYPAWALKDKDDWDMDEFKAHAQAKSDAKKGQGPDPEQVQQEAEEALEKLIAAGGGTAAVPAQTGPTLEEIKEQLLEEYPAWAVKDKDDWDKDDFKAHAKAKSAAKKGEGPDPDEVKAEVEEKLAAAKQQQQQTTVAGAVPQGEPGSKREAVARLKAQFPLWALKPRRLWTADDFREAADAKVAEMRDMGQSVDEIREAAQEAVDKVKRGEEVEEGAGVTQTVQRDLTDEELQQIREELLDEYPAWALKDKEDWDRDDFKDRAQTKSDAKKGESPPPEEIEQAAQEALEAKKQEWLQKIAQEEAASGGDGAGSGEIPEALFDEYPAWALKDKDDWDKDDFKAHAKAKSAAKRGEGPDPDQITAQAQEALKNA